MRAMEELEGSTNQLAAMLDSLVRWKGWVTIGGNLVPFVVPAKAPEAPVVAMRRRRFCIHNTTDASLLYQPGLRVVPHQALASLFREETDH